MEVYSWYFIARWYQLLLILIKESSKAGDDQAISTLPISQPVTTWWQPGDNLSQRVRAPPSCQAIDEFPGPRHFGVPGAIGEIGLRCFDCQRNSASPSRARVNHGEATDVDLGKSTWGNLEVTVSVKYGGFSSMFFRWNQILDITVVPICSYVLLFKESTGMYFSPSVNVEHHRFWPFPITGCTTRHHVQFI